MQDVYGARLGISGLCDSLIDSFGVGWAMAQPAGDVNNVWVLHAQGLQWQTVW